MMLDFVRSAPSFLAFPQGPQAPVEGRAGIPDVLEPADGLHVVGHHVGSRRDHRCHLGSPEIRHQHLDLHAWRPGFDRPDAGGEVAGAPVAQVIAVHGGDHRVLEAELFHRGGKLLGLLGPDGAALLAGGHGAEGSPGCRRRRAP
jgi:hypothetical protein